MKHIRCKHYERINNVPVAVELQYPQGRDANVSANNHLQCDDFLK
jgi:hypothetical protein